MDKRKSNIEDRDLAKLPSERAGHPASFDLVARRQGIAEAQSAGIWRTKKTPLQMTLAGVRVLRFRPRGPARGRVLHLHGGAFRIGCPEMMGPFAEALAAECDVEVVVPAYRLAPEHPFPAALRDAHAVMMASQEEERLPLIVSGDSAGGGLAAGLTAVCGADQIAGLVLLSPWLDLTASSISYQSNASTDPLFSLTAARDAAELYLQGTSPRDPLASPLFSSVALFPPTFVSVGEGEVLVEDSRAFDQALREAGIRSTLQVVADMEHVAVTRSLSLPGAALAFAGMAKFIGSRI